MVWKDYPQFTRFLMKSGTVHFPPPTLIIFLYHGAFCEWGKYTMYVMISDVDCKFVSLIRSVYQEEM